MALWRYGVMALWRYGVMALWRYGVMALWRSGVMALWCSGVMVMEFGLAFQFVLLQNQYKSLGPAAEWEANPETLLVLFPIPYSQIE